MRASSLSMTEIDLLLGQILFPYAALVGDRLKARKLLLTAIVPEPESLERVASLGEQSFFHYESGQTVTLEDGVTPIVAASFIHQSLALPLMLVLTPARAARDGARFALAVQLDAPVSGSALDSAIRFVLKDKKFESIYLEHQPLQPSDAALRDYKLALEKYRTANGLTVKLYFRQIMPLIASDGSQSPKPD